MKVIDPFSLLDSLSLAPNPGLDVFIPRIPRLVRPPRVASKVSGEGSLATRNRVDANEVSNLGRLAQEDTVTLAKVPDAGALAGKNKADISTDVTGAGTLATKNTANLDSDVTDGTSYARTTLNQRDGGGRAYNTHTSGSEFLPTKILNACPGKSGVVSTLISGSLTGGSGWTTVATCPFRVPDGTNSVTVTVTVSATGTTGSITYNAIRVSLGGVVVGGTGTVVINNPASGDQTLAVEAQLVSGNHDSVDASVAISSLATLVARTALT